MNKNILITGYYLDGYHGSVMHICELAEELTHQGYNVTISSVKICSHIKQYLENRTGAKVYYFKNTPLEIYYDYVIAYHSPILTYLLTQGIKFNKLAIGSLSSILPLEIPNILFTMGFPIIVHNYRLKEILAENFGIKEEKFLIFPNSVPQNYTTKVPQELRKIVIVSNHIPKELLQAAKILKGKGGSVDIVGVNHKTVPVTSDLLDKYDLVISIGKTIQYALYKGIPAYCYDHFGGEGYITKENIDLEESYNFSGRRTFRKLAAQNLVDEILSGYSQALEVSQILTKIAHQRYSIKNKTEKLIEFMNNDNSKFNKTSIFNSYSGLNDFYISELGRYKKIIASYKNCLYLYLLFYKIVNTLTLGQCYRHKLKNTKILIEEISL